jgi:glycosyltransferase involved in cell wall biosynthesis
VTSGSRAVLGIDAANLRRGGGVTHLVEFLSAADPERHGFGQIVVWSGDATLDRLPDRPWLRKVGPPALSRGLLQRTWWQRAVLSKAARAAGCDVLLVPGGSYAGSFRPIVAMSQNLLPFEWTELRRYGVSTFTAKLLLLRLVQGRTFRLADGVIFLTDYAQQVVRGVVGRFAGQTTVIAHGIDRRFAAAPRPQRDIGDYSASEPFRLVYVSTVDLYKHQGEVVRAVAKLRARGLPVTLELVGPAYPPALRALEATMDAIDPNRDWVHYLGAIPHDRLHDIYQRADLGLFASSCENQPIILLETMAAGLPIACSNRGPMPAMLGDAGSYFDPEQPESIAAALTALIDSPQRRRTAAEEAFRRAAGYSWPSAAASTLAFLASVAAAGAASPSPQDSR